VAKVRGHRRRRRWAERAAARALPDSRRPAWPAPGAIEGFRPLSSRIGRRCLGLASHSTGADPIEQAAESAISLRAEARYVTAPPSASSLRGSGNKTGSPRRPEVRERSGDMEERGESRRCGALSSGVIVQHRIPTGVGIDPDEQGRITTGVAAGCSQGKIEPSPGEEEPVIHILETSRRRGGTSASLWLGWATASSMA